MAVEGIGNLGRSLADQFLGQTQEAQAGTIPTGTGNAGNGALTEDTFTPSTQNNSAQATAQDAGIFQVGQGVLTAVTANILFDQATPNATPGRFPTPAASSTNQAVGNAQPPAGTNSNTSVNLGQLFAATPPGQTPAAKAAPATNVQEQIQALNSALPALGLSKVEIQEIDSLASQLQNFNPATYTNLVNQFEALARQATPQDAANAAANAGTGASQNTAANTKTNGSGSPG